MKKETTEKTPTSKRARLARLTPVLYSPLALGVCTVLTIAATYPKLPAVLGD